MKYVFWGAGIAAAVAAVCVIAFLIIRQYSKAHVTDGPGNTENSYRQISQDEAKRMMKQNDGHIIVDVRTFEEYDGGHIPGAVCIQNESISKEPPEELPDFDQVILIYCRSGRRSKEAARKLFDMGYKNVCEFGGIIDWTGETTVTDNTESRAALMVRIGEKTLCAALENNSSAAEFVEKLSFEPITVEMSDYGNFEKVGDLPWTLTRNDALITTKPGDIILYQGDKITIYYDENTYSFTRLGSIGASGKELREILGEGNVTVSFFVEWSE